MSALTRLILFFSLVHIKGQRPHGEKCVYDGDCKNGLLCAFEDKLFNPHRICQCPPELVYVDGHCEKAKNEVEIAEILAIIIPVISSVIVTILVILGCCCWIHSSNLNIEKEVKQKAVQQKVEPPEFELKEVSIEPRNNVKTAKKKRKIQQEIPIETNRGKDKIPDENFQNFENPKISVISDPGYQANMKYLLRRPHSTSYQSNGLLTSRPNSAATFYHNLDSQRPNSRSSSASSRKSSALNGPYLTEPLKRPLRPRSPKPNQNGQIQNGQALYENILAVVEADTKTDNTQKGNFLKN